MYHVEFFFSSSFILCVHNWVCSFVSMRVRQVNHPQWEVYEHRSLLLPLEKLCTKSEWCLLPHPPLCACNRHGSRRGGHASLESACFPAPVNAKWVFCSLLPPGSGDGQSHLQDALAQFSAGPSCRICSGFSRSPECAPSVRPLAPGLAMTLCHRHIKSEIYVRRWVFTFSYL